MSEKIRQKIADEIRSASDVGPGNYVSVSLQKLGFLGMGKKQIQLTGRASSDTAKVKIEEIAKANAEGLEIISSIRIGKTG